MSVMSAEPRGTHGEVFLDARGNGRAMRLTWHHEVDLVVLSLWRDDVCAGTFRLSSEDVNTFIDALVDGMRDAPGVQDREPEALTGEALPPVQRASAAPDELDYHSPQHVEPATTGESFHDWAFGEPSPRATA
jgi:hypothetical protein